MHHIIVARTERQTVLKTFLTDGRQSLNELHCVTFPEFRNEGENAISINNRLVVLNSRIPVCGLYGMKSAHGNSLKCKTRY